VAKFFQKSFDIRSPKKEKESKNNQENRGKDE